MADSGFNALIKAAQNYWAMHLDADRRVKELSAGLASLSPSPLESGNELKRYRRQQQSARLRAEISTAASESEVLKTKAVQLTNQASLLRWGIAEGHRCRILKNDSCAQGVVKSLRPAAQDKLMLVLSTKGGDLLFILGADALNIDPTNSASSLLPGPSKPALRLVKKTAVA